MVEILITDEIAPEAVIKLECCANVTNRQVNAEELRQIIGDYEILIVRGRTKVTKEVIDLGKKLKLIARAGVGVDNIDIEHATKRKIIVINAPTSSTIAVAELAIGMMIALSRKLIEAHNTTKNGNWEKSKFLGYELSGKTLGIIGFGRIGIELAKRANSFNMEIIAYDPYQKDEVFKQNNVSKTDIDTLMKSSDYISVHANLTNETKNLINEKRLSLMKKSAFIINCARGGIIDEQALFKYLKNNYIAGAALDVYQKEPITKDNPLLTLPNVLLTPHIGALTHEAQLKAGNIISNEIIKYINNEKLTFVVNPEVLEN